ncbi:MAG: endopeptidase La [Gammaproteobacteria bacterium]
MDIDQEQTVESAGDKSGLVRAAEVLPSVIHLVPQQSRPFFPGQAIPLVVDESWEKTIKAVNDAKHGIVGIVLTRDIESRPVRPDDFYDMGTACRIHRVQKQEGKFQILMEGLQRFRIGGWISNETPFSARVRYYQENVKEQTDEVKAYAVAVINTIKELVPLNPLYGQELKVFLDHFHPNEPSRLADFAASLTTASKEDLQGVLETVPLLPRLEKVLLLISRELDLAKAQMRIRKQVEEEMQGRQREAFLREQLKAIQKELGLSKDDRTAEAEKFRARMKDLTIPEHAENRIEDELQKLSLLETGSPEYAVTRNYLDWLTLVPWGKHTKDSPDLKKARKILDRDHEALDDVKDRILEFIGVGIMRGEVAGSILLFVGPPGVGKTSLGRSIAETLNRKFFRFSLGGMRDEAEIKGHRRTYIGAMPGKFIQAIKDTKSANPVIMLDEIDKVGASYRGDPASALLEVLDPEQNADFLDHYLDVQFDLSKVLFIATANQLDTIPRPLLDRMEIIRLSGYLASEKLAIARKHLWPRQLRRAGLKPRGQVRIDTAAIRKIIEDYAREAGVRRLEKLLGTIARKATVKILKRAKTPLHVRTSDVDDYLGKARFAPDKRISGVGVITGLAWTALGGATLNIEANRIHEFNRGMRLTGQLGDVMRESANIASSYIVANTERYGIDPDYFEKAYVHLHVPAGATPKDGPSAGAAMASALLSLARNRRPRPIAMTGELTLTGQVLPIGGVREKVIAAKRVNIKELILPEDNRADFDELPKHIREGLKMHFVSHFDEIEPLLFGKTKKRRR